MVVELVGLMCAGTHVVPGIVLGREQKLHYDPHLLSSHSIDALISRTSKHVQVGMPVFMCTHIPDKVCIHVQLHALPCLVVPTPPPPGWWWHQLCCPHPNTQASLQSPFFFSLLPSHPITMDSQFMNISQTHLF